MGCTQSKIENEETVTRCKERKLFMKEAVGARNAFAAAHSSYAVSLKNTGAALHDYAQGEAQFTSAAAAAAATAGSSPVAGSSVGIPPSMSSNYDLPPPPPLPPPLPPFFTPSPLQRAATMPEISIPTPDLKREDPIIEETEEEIEDESVHGLKHRSIKSSGGGVGIGGTGSASHKAPEEDFPPPTPPSPPRTPPQSIPMPPPPLHENWDFFSWDNDAGPTLEDVDEGRVEREELQRKLLEEEAKRRANDANDGGRRSGKEEATEVAEKVDEPPTQPPPPQAATKVAKRVKVQAPPEGKKKAGPPANLLQIFSELDDYFLRASESAHEVSKMLEANRLHYHSNFADPKGSI